MAHRARPFPAEHRDRASGRFPKRDCPMLLTREPAEARSGNGGGQQLAWCNGIFD